jgi:hypothetical protein
LPKAQGATFRLQDDHIKVGQMACSSNERVPDATASSFANLYEHGAHFKGRLINPFNERPSNLCWFM